MRFRSANLVYLMIVGSCALGCHTSADRLATTPVAEAGSVTPVVQKVPFERVSIDPVSVDPVPNEPATVEPVAFQDKQPPIIDSDDSTAPLPLPVVEQLQRQPELLATPAEINLSLDEVINSVRSHFPLILQAAAGRRIAAGQALSASGAFDHKLDAISSSQPLDFYENYRHSIGVKRDTTWGGQTFAGYRVGRGVFEPWYLERETNKGGEFKAGFMAPLIRDRWIDANRAELWQAQLERRRVEPEILAQVIRFVQEGSIAYWGWVAAGAKEQIATGLLDLALERNQNLVEQVEAQEKAPIDLVDNRRIITSRESKLIDAQRKLQQSTVKLSLFYRTFEGEPILLDLSMLPDEYFNRVLYEADPADFQLLTDDEVVAQAQRPELAELQIIRQQLCVALRQAQNETRPDVDGGFLIAQDVGEPTSSKRDKSEFEVEALVTVSVPLERRKAVGKVRSLRGKLAQLTIKNRFAVDKIVADVRITRTAVEAAKERVSRATENFNLSQQMRVAEQELFDQGQSTLFNLNIREKQAAEAASERIEAQLEFQIARVSYAAALGSDSQNFE